MPGIFMADKLATHYVHIDILSVEALPNLCLKVELSNGRNGIVCFKEYVAKYNTDWLNLLFLV